MREISISQSMLKDFEEVDVCLKDWWAKWVTREVTHEPSIYMAYGSYFESKCIGSGADGKSTNDLPRKINGERYAHHVRIDEQVEKFKRLFDEKSLDYIGLKILDTQLRAVDKFMGYRSSGVLDMICEDVWTGNRLIVDLKLTGDLNSTFGKYQFTADEVDLIQPTWYIDLYKDMNIDGFSYLIFDYSPRLNVRRLDVEISIDDVITLNERKENMIMFIEKNINKDAPCTCDNCNKAILT